MKTNKIYLCAFAALALSACSEQDDFTQADIRNAAVENADVPVQFDTYMGKTGTTRAYGTTASDYQKGTITNDGANSTTMLSKAEFGVFSYHSGTYKLAQLDGTTGKEYVTPNFMYNEYIKWNSSSSYWYYSPVKYWPNGIDLANTENNNSPSNTATETAPQYLSFYAYAPFTKDHTTFGTKYSTANYGAFPITSSDENSYFQTAAYSGAKGIVGMSSNAITNEKGIWLNYVLDNPSTSEGVDMLWGLRGQYTYDETDNVNNTIDKLGAAYNTNLTKQSVDEKVRFLFKHALAKVGGATATSTGGTADPAQGGLKVVLDVDANSTNPGAGADNQDLYQGTKFNADANLNNTLVTINSVTIRDAFTYTKTDDTGATITNVGSDLNTYGWFDITTGTWKNTGHAAAENLENETTATAGGGTFKSIANDATLNADIKEGTVKNSTGVAWQNTESSEEGYTGGASGVTTSLKNVYADANVPGIFMIPGSEPQTIYVTVDYVVRTADPKLNPTGTATAADVQAYTEVNQVITNAVKLSNLEANKYYTLVMHLGLTSVKFEAIVADWSGSSNDTYDENGNVIPAGTPETKSVWLPSNVVNTTTITADAGTSHKHVTVDATATAYTVNLTGAGDDGTVAFTTTSTAKDLEGNSVTTSAGIDVSTTNTANSSVSVSGGAATISLTLKPNYSSTAVVNTVVITRDGGESTTVTITQAPRVIILTPTETNVSDKAVPFTVKATTGNGQPIAWADYDISTTSGTITSDAAQQTAGIIQVTPAANTGATTNAITVTVTVKNAKVSTSDTAATASTVVTQASAE